MNRRVSFRLISALSLAVALVGCAEDVRTTEADDDEDLQQEDEPADESDKDNDASEAAPQPSTLCNTFATIYRDQATAQKVTNDGQGRLMCLLSIDEAGVGNGWTVSYGSNCKCPEPRVLKLP